MQSLRMLRLPLLRLLPDPQRESEPPTNASKNTIATNEMWIDNRYIFDRLRAPINIQSAIDILIKEKQVTALCHVYVERFRFFASWGNRFKAKNAAKTALEHLALVIGRDAAEKEEIARWYRAPEAFGIA